MQTHNGHEISDTQSMPELGDTLPSDLSEEPSSKPNTKAGSPRKARTVPSGPTEESTWLQYTPKDIRGGECDTTHSWA